MVNAGAQSALRPVDFFKGFNKMSAQIFDGIGASVCQRVLRLRPDPFVGIQLGRIGRKGFQVKPFESATEIADGLPFMRGNIVPYYDHIPPKMFEEMTQKFTYLRTLDILCMEDVVQSKTLESGTERERRDHGDALADKVIADSRGVGFRTPGLAQRRGQEEARLVYEDDMGAQPLGVFFIRGHWVRFH